MSCEAGHVPGPALQSLPPRCSRVHAPGGSYQGHHAAGAEEPDLQVAAAGVCDGDGDCHVLQGSHARELQVGAADWERGARVGPGWWLLPAGPGVLLCRLTGHKLQPPCVCVLLEPRSRSRGSRTPHSSAAHPERFGHCRETIPRPSPNHPTQRLRKRLAAPEAAPNRSDTGAGFGERSGMRNLVARPDVPAPNHSQLRRGSAPGLLIIAGETLARCGPLLAAPAMQRVGAGGCSPTPGAGSPFLVLPRASGGRDSSGPGTWGTAVPPAAHCSAHTSPNCLFSPLPRAALLPSCQLPAPFRAKGAACPPALALGLEQGVTLCPLGSRSAGTCLAARWLCSAGQDRGKAAGSALQLAH